MSEVTERLTGAAGEPVPSIAGMPAAVPERGRPALAAVAPVAWARANLFSGWLSTAVTLALIYLIARWAIGFFQWGVLNAVW